MRGIENLGYRRSRYDPCVFCLMDESGPQGHILNEVDDLATHGNAVHAENIAKLQKTFKFGKWKSICDSEGNYARSNRHSGQSYGFHIREAKFVQERLSPIMIPRGTSFRQEIRKPLMVKRGKCVQYGARSIGSNERAALTCRHRHHLTKGSLNHSTVQDLCDANVAVERLKAEPFLGVKLPHIPIHHVRWATV